MQDKTATGFVVQELEGGAGHVLFAYRIVARRRDVAANIRGKGTAAPAGASKAGNGRPALAR